MRDDVAGPDGSALSEGLGAAHNEGTTEVWGVAVMAPMQKGAAEKHCFGDCGKISMAGAINDELTGGLFVCCQPACPYEAKVIENYGQTMSFGRPHNVHLRLLEPVA